MRALLAYPRYPDTFWSFRYALEFIDAKAAFPPLGLLTLAAMMPPDWSIRLKDLNVEPLTDQDLDWADMVFVSAMSIQSVSADEIISRARTKGVKVCAGGPHFTHFHEQIPGVDHFVLDEAEEVFPRFLEDLEAGQAKPLYRSEGFPELSLTPVPRWDLVDFSNYTSMLLQLSRGCPFDCDFCDVVYLFGRKPRYKSPPGFLKELDALLTAGWRGNILIVDDNFIGNTKRAKEVLQALVDWQTRHGHPFFFVTEASINLAKESEILDLMARADFKQVFIGIETPSSDALGEANKKQNQNLDMVAEVKKIQSYGLEVIGGFIVGFDSDPPTIFEDQIRFIEEAAIPVAMVGILTAPPGTKLWKRLEAEGRILGNPTGDNAMDEAALNFVPKIDRRVLIDGYQTVLDRIFTPKAFYQRVLNFFNQYRPNPHAPARRPKPREVKAFFRILWKLGVQSPHKTDFRQFLKAVVKQKHDFGKAIDFAASGHHLYTTSRRFAGQRKPDPNTSGK